MGHAKPNPYKQHISSLTPPPEHAIAPRDPEIYLSTSPWQIMDYDYELEQKRLLLQELFPNAEIPLPSTDGKDFHYRNKMEYALYWDNAEQNIKLAFHQRNSHRKIPFTHSSIERPEILARAQEIIADLNARGEQARTYQSLLLRCDQQGRVSGGLLKNHESHPTFPPLTDTLLGHPYTYSPNGFFQINLPVYELALTEIAKHLGDAEKVLDLYAGVGTIGLSTARDRKLTLVETNASAYAELVKNCLETNKASEQNLHDLKLGSVSKRGVHAPISSPGAATATLANGGSPLGIGQDGLARVTSPEFDGHEVLPNITPILAKSEDSTTFITSDTTVIIDPPRAGLHQKLVQALNATRSPKIIYLSCNPTTQSRDIALLAENYRITHLQPFNFFPRTPHIENLAILVKK